VTRRQPEIGSALGLTTDEVIERAQRRIELLAAVREHLTSALAEAIDSLNDGRPPIDVAAKLHISTGRMLAGNPTIRSKAA